MSTATVPSFILAIALTGLAGTAPATELIRVTPNSREQWEQLFEVAPEAGDCGSMQHSNGLEFAIDANGRAKLEALGFDVSVQIADLESHAREGIVGGGPFGLYHTYTEAITDMDALVAEYPDLISAKLSIGQTVEGREIYVYKISDNPQVDEDEPEVFFNAYIHAREAITFECLFGLAQHLLGNYDSDPEVQDLVNNREIYLMPAVNPDGVEYNALTNPGGGGLWRKNRSINAGGARGVDLNRNFGYLWGYDNSGSSGTPSSETYRGPSPFSEPETAAVRDFVLSRNFSIVVNYHAYGRLEIFSPEYDAASSAEYDELLALAHLRSETSGYRAGPTWHVLYPINGGANDWMHSSDGKPSIPSILTEVGTQFWPPESQINTLVAENLPGNLQMIALADNPLRALTPAVAEVLDPGPVGSTFHLHWIDPNSDPDNLSARWNVMEGTNPTVGADDLEGDIEDRWNNRGWTRRSNRAVSGQFSLASGLGNGRNDFLESTRAYRVSPGDELTFQAWYQLEVGYDYTYVEIATESRDFVAIAGSITTTDNPQGKNTGNGINGNSGGWVLATFDLSDYAGETVWFRFHTATDRGTALAGFYIDDISPTHLFETESVLATDLDVREWLVTGKSDGDYAYMVQPIDGEGQAGPFSAPALVSVANTTAVDDEPATVWTDWTGLRLLGRHPFSERATLAFDVPSGAAVGDVIELRIHDVNGRAVTAPLRGVVGGSFRSAGSGSDPVLQIVGHPDTHPGSSVALTWSPERRESGVYFATLRIGSRVSQRRLLRLRSSR